MAFTGIGMLAGVPTRLLGVSTVETIPDVEICTVEGEVLGRGQFSWTEDGDLTTVAVTEYNEAAYGRECFFVAKVGRDGYAERIYAFPVGEYSAGGEDALQTYLFD